jgi:hypothetical protein
LRQLEDLVKSGEESEGVLFRRLAYSKHTQEDLLKDVLSLANAKVDGERYIILGAEPGIVGSVLTGIPRESIEATHRYQAVIRDYIEPPLHMHSVAFYAEGKQMVGLVLDGCDDKPYMMRSDHSPKLNRGDAWIRVKTENQRMGRRQLEAIFADRFAEPLFSGKLLVGFDSDMVTNELAVQTVDPGKLPSVEARAKLQTLIDAKEQAGTPADENTFITRLTHARLFGADQPYQSHSVTELRQELDKLQDRYRDADDYYRFVEAGQKLNLAVVNQSTQEIQAASIALMLPRSAKFQVASRKPANPARDPSTRKVFDDESNYPTVSELNTSYQITENLGTVAPGMTALAFREPLRLFADKALAGKRVVIYYKLFGRNLRRPIAGKLDLKLVHVQSER